MIEELSLQRKSFRWMQAGVVAAVLMPLIIQFVEGTEKKTEVIVVPGNQIVILNEAPDVPASEPQIETRSATSADEPDTAPSSVEPYAAPRAASPAPANRPPREMEWGQTQVAYVPTSTAMPFDLENHGQ